MSNDWGDHLPILFRKHVGWLCFAHVLFTMGQHTVRCSVVIDLKAIWSTKISMQAPTQS